MAGLKELLGRRIRELRNSRKLTQEKLSELIGIEGSSVSKLERGHFYPTAKHLEKIAAILDVEPYRLFMFSHHKSKEELLNDIAKLLESAKEEKLRLAYKVLVDILE